MATIELPPSPGRVPRTVIPTHYDLTYTSIDLERHTFAGVVSISVDAPSPIPSLASCQAVPTDDAPQVILLHAIEIDILSATFAFQLGASGDEQEQEVRVAAYEFRYHRPTQTCALLFCPSAIPPSCAGGRLVIDFRGTLNDLMHGFYRSSYQSLDGRELTIATTQFEPTDARRAFPCFDEPALKATFRLRVTIRVDPSRPSLSCWSNTPVANEYTAKVMKPGRGEVLEKKYEFEVTPKMSTYLVAVIVAELDGIATTPTEGPTAGVTTTVYTVPGKSEQGRFCLEVASRCLEFFAGELFGIPYPLSKSDLVAVPDFAAGAMENYGLVTYREAKILVNETTSESMKRGIARTVAHELAHQWFGNLVTPAFWTELWLKEGAARFLEFVAIDRLFPKWKAWELFCQGVYSIALNLDAMISSHPVEVEVQSADEIGEIFDTISYAKGASVIRMLASYVGKDNFFEGMRLYLERHKCGNAVSSDLWQALQDTSGLPVVDIALPWTLQTGYPIVLLEEGKNLECPRFLASGPDSHPLSSETKWPIPITVIVEGEDEVMGPWLIGGPNGDESEKLLAKIAEWTCDDKFFKINADQTGFFRVSYTDSQWKRLRRAMSPGGQLSATDRLGLISDSFAAGRAGYASISDSLDFIKNFGLHETAEYVVWQELSDNLSALASLYKSEPFFANFQGFLQNMYANQMERIGWDENPGDDEHTSTLRATIINMMGLARDTGVLEEGLKRFKSFVENPNTSLVTGDVRTAIFRTALRADEGLVSSELKRIFETTDDPGVQRSCLSVMGRVKDGNRHAEMLDYVLFSGKVRYQDMAFVLNGLATTTGEGGRRCWDNFVADFDQLASKFRQQHVVWGMLLGVTTRGLKTLEEANEAEQFFAEPEHPAGAGQRRVAQALEAVRTNALRLDRDRNAVASFLDRVVVT